ncbi:MAG: hypothetical protein WEC79_02075, partial [Thermomicrobiales bacterium]
AETATSASSGAFRMEHRIGKRIIVVGSSNAGKSTLAAWLADALDAPFIELDALHWEPGWVEADDDVFRDRVRRAIQTDSWVMDGNYIPQQQDISWPDADTIVWLDLSLATVLRRCVRRTWRRWRTRELLYGGTNRENFREHLMIWSLDKSLISHILRTHRARRRTYTAAPIDPRWSHITFIRLRSVEEVERWLDSIVASFESADMKESTGELKEPGTAA